jgi:hypothetical protein
MLEDWKIEGLFLRQKGEYLQHLYDIGPVVQHLYDRRIIY